MAFEDVFVDEVRRAADIVRVISDHVSLKRVGVSWKGLCPFHQEKTPSFNVRSDPPIFHCFGCGEGGDVFKFVMRRESCSFPEAVELLARRFGLTVPERTLGGGPDRQAQEQVLAALEAAALHYQRRLWSPAGRAALDYLLGRGFQKSTLERIRAGAAADEWEDLSAALSKQFSDEVLLNAGLVLPGKEGRRPYDRFRHRAVFPIVSDAGRVVAFGARSLDGSEPKYLNSPETPVYQKSRTLYGLYWAKDPIRREGRIVVMEGYLDVARAIEAGVGESVATCGTALTSSHARLLRRFSEVVVLNFDQDEAGQAAAARSFEALSGEGLQLHVVELPQGHDPDTFLKEFGAEAYRERLRDAPPFIEWALRRALTRHDVSLPLGQAAFAKELMPLLKRVDNAVERSAWVKRAAEVARLDPAALESELRRSQQVPAPAPRPQAQAPRRTEMRPAEKWLLSLCINGAEGIEEALGELDEADVAHLPTSSLWLTLLGLVRRGNGVDAAALEAQLEDEKLKALVRELALRPMPTGDATPLRCVREMKCWPLEARSAEILRELKQGAADAQALLRELAGLKQSIAEVTRATLAAS